MRIDLPQCNLKTCLYSFDGNCTNKNRYEACEYQLDKVEIERLTNYNTNLMCANEDVFYTMEKNTRIAITKAIQAFAEMLKEYKCSYDLDNYHSFEAVELDVIDDAVKEFLGEKYEF